FPSSKDPPVVLVASDARGSKDLARRAEAAAEFDLTQRKARYGTKEEMKYLPRSLELEARLGMTRDQVGDVLPRGQTILREKLPDGIGLTFKGEPDKSAVYILRQMFTRFGPADPVAELRLRYEAGPACPPTAPWFPPLFNMLKKRGGAPEEVPT